VPADNDVSTLSILRVYRSILSISESIRWAFSSLSSS
jgi:hypothetical protein